LWWLGGKSSFMAPGTQFVFPGSYAPNAPADMFAGIGKNGQIVSISRSKALVVVRMGDAPTNLGEVPFLLCDQIWQKLNEVMCNGTSINENQKNQHQVSIFPNPANSILNIDIPSEDSFEFEIIDLFGKTILTIRNQNKIDVSNLEKGIYIIKIIQGENYYIQKFVKE